jgi:zinc protease
VSKANAPFRGMPRHSGERAALPGERREPARPREQSERAVPRHRRATKVSERAIPRRSRAAKANAPVRAERAAKAPREHFPVGHDRIVLNVQIPFSKRTLDNGLDVIVHEHRQLPMVAVNVWYHVGSKNERPGRTGFAHLFEHLMFEGSEHYDKGFFQPLQQAGGLLNGSTNPDRTNYWEVVPTGALELALWMESDRMGYLLPALTREKFENQRDVVLNERRQNYENRPYGLAGMAISEALFARDHPYHWLTIGSADDLRAMQLDEVREFFATYYHPGNASLSLAGDIDADEGFALAEAYFGSLPAGPRPAPVAAQATLDSGPRLLLEDRVELARIYLAWHSPAMFADADAELDLMADLISHGKTSRLYRTLVYEKQIAADVVAYQHSREISGVFQIAATAVPGVPLAVLYDEIMATVAAVARDGPSNDELERARVQTDAQFVYRIQTIGGFGGKSDQLNAYNVFRGDPGYFAGDRERYDSATSAGIAGAVDQWLVKRPHVVLSVVPRGATDRALPGSVEVHVS